MLITQLRGFGLHQCTKKNAATDTIASPKINGKNPSFISDNLPQNIPTLATYSSASWLCETGKTDFDATAAKVLKVRTAAIRSVFGVLVWMHLQRMSGFRRFCGKTTCCWRRKCGL